MIRILAGDCRDVFPTLAANSVHTVVTSPPYYGLRDYGTAQWDSGDAGCDHAMQRSVSASTLMNDGRATIGLLPDHKYAAVGNPYRAICGKCGARRIDRQIGLEATPDEYIQTMVAVFREVRRVLREDGTCWVNMGDHGGRRHVRRGGGLSDGPLTWPCLCGHHPWLHIDHCPMCGRAKPAPKAEPPKDTAPLTEPA